MELADILTEDSVLAYRRANDKSALLEIIAKRAATVLGQDTGTVFEALAAREALGSTGLGNGIAIPHGKLAGIGRVSAIFVKLDEPLEFDAVDDLPVDLVMALFAPVGAGADHLKALAHVARLLRTEALVEGLRSSDQPARLYDLLTAPVASQHAA
jgi:PTS system nitrogen regulatory IIA component